jgi:20S proteasome subunit beta 6
MQPFLDNQIGYKNLTYPRVSTPLDKAIKIIQDAFTAAAERDIYTGDYLEIHIIKKDGITRQIFDLKKD